MLDAIWIGPMYLVYFGILFGKKKNKTTYNNWSCGLRIVDPKYLFIRFYLSVISANPK